MSRQYGLETLLQSLIEKLAERGVLTERSAMEMFEHALEVVSGEREATAVIDEMQRDTDRIIARYRQIEFPMENPQDRRD